MRQTVIALILFATPALFAGDVLVYETNSTGHGSAQAAVAQSHTVTTVTTSTGFLTEITSPTAWDLVMVEIANDSMSDDAALLLDSYVGGGGKAILSYARLDSGGSDGATLRATFQIATATDLPTTLDIQASVPADPIWTTPTAVPNPIPTFASVPWGDWGDALTAAAGASTVATFAPGPTGPLGAAIVSGNSGRTLCNGFVYDIYEPSVMINLLRNQIALLAPTTGGLPVFVRGDVDGGGSMNIQDVVLLLNHLFVVPAPPTPPCLEALDIDASGGTNLADAVLLLTFLFQSGVAPAPPFPSCAPSAAPMGCNSFPACGFP